MIRNIITFCTVLLFSCATTGSGPQSLLFTDHTLAIYSDGESSKKQGESCAYSVLGLIAWGDASSQTSQKNAYVTKIRSIDQRSFSFLGSYAKLCTIVKGN
jgi:hypothetical protein